MQRRNFSMSASILAELLIIIRVLLIEVLFSDKKIHWFGHLVFPNDISFLFSKNGNTGVFNWKYGLLSGFYHLFGVLWDKGKCGASLREAVHVLCSTHLIQGSPAAMGNAMPEQAGVSCRTAPTESPHWSRLYRGRSGKMEPLRIDCSPPFPLPLHCLEWGEGGGRGVGDEGVKLILGTNGGGRGALIFRFVLHHPILF